MEHRHQLRVPVDLKMFLYRRGLPVAIGTIRDASRLGVFLETQYPELREHQHLEFEFRLAGQPGDIRYRVAAQVMRRAPDGAALEIDETDKAASQAMNCLINARSAGQRVLRH